MNNKATIYDLSRLCNYYNKKDCEKCPLYNEDCGEYGDCVMNGMLESDIKGLNKIVLAWVKEHPVKTYLEDFVDKFPAHKQNKRLISSCLCREFIYHDGLCLLSPNDDNYCDPNDEQCEKCWNEAINKD